MVQRFDAHPTTNGGTIASATAQPQARGGRARRRALILERDQRAIIDAHHQVGVTVAVEVRGGETLRVASYLESRRLPIGGLESAAAVADQQLAQAAVHPSGLG